MKTQELVIRVAVTHDGDSVSFAISDAIMRAINACGGPVNYGPPIYDEPTEPIHPNLAADLPTTFSAHVVSTSASWVK